MKTDDKRHHPAADAMDWNEAVGLIQNLTKDGRYRDSMLIATGCMLGLRVSDIVKLTWAQLLDGDTVRIVEQKTGKTRNMRINKALRNQTDICFRNLDIKDKNSYIFCSAQKAGTKPITRVRVHQILKDLQQQYNVTSAKVFSCHSLRKTFGRRIWLNECRRGRGDQALELLKELFGHEHVLITKRYLGIRQEELLALYDKLIES